MEEKGKLAQWSKHFHHLVKRSPGEFRNVYLVPLRVPGTTTTLRRQGCWLELGQSGDKAT